MNTTSFHHFPPAFAFARYGKQHTTCLMTSPARFRTFTDYLTVAQALSAYLDALGIQHAYIGGFAWACLGSVRPTEMSTDVLITGKNIMRLWDQVMDFDTHLGDDLQLTFYHITMDAEEVLAREDIVRTCHDNTRIVILPADEMGLPGATIPIFSAGETGIRVLHPVILILTSFKRWSTAHTSNRPKTIKQAALDHADIQFVIEWLVGEQERIPFHRYKSDTKLELLAIIRQYHDKYVGDVDQMARLRSLMPDDWSGMLSLPEPSTAP